MKNTVKVLYGVNANTDCYLKKFVDVEYLLPLPNGKNFIKYLIEEKYTNITDKIQNLNTHGYMIWKNHQNNWIQYPFQEQNYTTNKLMDILQSYSVQLRDIEKVILKLSIIINFFSNDEVLCLPFLADLILLNIYHPKIYNYIKQKTPPDNYHDIEYMRNLSRETFSIIKTINSRNLA